MVCWHTEFGLDVLFSLGLHWIMSGPYRERERVEIMRLSESQ